MCGWLQEGDIQLWGVEQRGLLDSTRIGEGQATTALAAFADRPYVLLGCDDGSVRVRIPCAHYMGLSAHIYHVVNT
jgi:hypothetical protein